MILCIADILDGDFCERARETLSSALFVDGAQTAGWSAKALKNNEQANANDPAVAALKAGICARIHSSAIFASAALPARFGPVLLSRYRPGQEYGAHVDNAVMASNGEMIRNDLAFTLFLSAPDAYDGGELVVQTNGAEDSYKLPAGAMLLYPARHLHSVAPVTRGERLACVGWLQSLVRHAEQREILYDLDLAKRAIHASQGNSETFQRIAKTSANLMRLWVES
jgi:PKHD-type hydroxylase